MRQFFVFLKQVLLQLCVFLFTPAMVFTVGVGHLRVTVLSVNRRVFTTQYIRCSMNRQQYLPLYNVSLNIPHKHYCFLTNESFTHFYLFVWTRLIYLYRCFFSHKGVQ